MSDRGTDILKLLTPHFEDIERWDQKVGSIFLHPEEIMELLRSKAAQACFDRAYYDPQLFAAYPDLKGYVFGAMVFACRHIRHDHVIVLPDGIAPYIDGKCTIIGDVGRPLGDAHPEESAKHWSTDPGRIRST